MSFNRVFTITEGRLTPTHPGRLALDRGFLYGDGLYETIRLYEGRPFALIEHLERLQIGCEIMGIDFDMRAVGWRRKISELVTEAQLGAADAKLRITVTRGITESFKSFDSGEPTVAFLLEPIDQTALDRKRDQGLAVTIAADRRMPGAESFRIKSTSCASTVLALRAAQSAGADDVLFLNSLDEVCETSTANVFVVREGSLVTPPLNAPCLNGITRRAVIELAAQLNLHVHQAPVTVPMLLDAEEVFLTSSIAEVMPVSSVDGKILTRRENSIAGSLQNLLRQGARQTAVTDSKNRGRLF